VTWCRPGMGVGIISFSIRFLASQKDSAPPGSQI
jgi:hypothetical protein